MVCLKKSTCDELLQLALLLSLLRADPDTYLRREAPEIVGVRVETGQAWALAGPRGPNFDNRRPYIHPKSLDSELINYEREVFEELNALGRYNRINAGIYNVTAYLLNVDGNSPDDDFGADNASSSGLLVDNERPTVSATEEYAEASSSGLSGFPFLFDDDESDPSLADTADLSQEDMDLIEVLWKQDVDLGFSLEELQPADKPGKSPADDDAATLKAIAASDPKPRSKKDDDSEDEHTSNPDDPWAGLSYTIDLETGEYVLKDSLCEELSNTPATILVDEAPSSLLDLQEFSLEEALQLVGLNESSTEATKEDSPLSEPAIPAPPAKSATDGDVKKDTAEKDPLETPSTPDEELGDMIQTAQFHHPHPHPRSFQGRVPVVRTASVEQRWQDLANLLSLPGEGVPGHTSYPHHPHHPHPHHPHIGYGGSAAGGAVGGYGEAARGVLLHNATLAPPVGDMNATSPYHSHSVGSNSNLGTAVAASMNLTNSSEPMGDAGSTASYKMESSHDMMYYQNSTTEISQTTEGFLSSILNDEDLQLMDMAMNDSMYTMRMLDATGSPTSASSAAHAGTPTSGATAVAASGPGAASAASPAAAAAAAAAAADERMDASSDSAVSSMGSERVPSLSDGEWMETGSDSGHTAGDHYGAADYHASKYRPYDYSYSGRQHTSSVSTAETQHRVPPMAQKKHQMFGKRCFQEQGAGGASSLGSHGTTPSLPPAPVKYEFSEAVPAGGNAFGTPLEAGVAAAKAPEMKYSCSVEFARHHPEVRPPIDHIQHNHSYHLPAESTGALQRPVSRDKQKGRKSDEEHLNRDEKRARAMNIPLPVSDIINLPMDEFNERLSKYDLSEAQLSLIRDIRRRGKNKVAAQNCRKRKLDQILSLADEVKEMRDRKTRLVQERDYMLSERQRVKEKFSQLYRHIFQQLRDPDGNQYSMCEYSLQQSADGTVLLVPRANATAFLDPEATTAAASCRKREEEKE